MRVYTIYKATNDLTGQCYIGFDSSWPTRKTAHNCQAFRERSNAYHSYFHNAIRKYGTETFGWEILYQSTDKLHTLRIMEPHFIMEHNSYGRGGYNCTSGGDNWPVQINTRDKLTPRKHSYETKRKMAQSKVKSWVLTNPIGETLYITDLNRFCKTQNLKVSNMSNVAHGLRAQHKGWICRLEGN